MILIHISAAVRWVEGLHCPAAFLFSTELETLRVSLRFISVDRWEECFGLMAFDVLHLAYLAYVHHRRCQISGCRRRVLH